jgi:hypothetical protein
MVGADTASNFQSSNPCTLSTSNHANSCDGVSAQVNSNPLGWFENHAIIRYDTSSTGFYLFDPSYGSVSFKSYKSWETESLFGYGYEIGAFTGVTCTSDSSYRQSFEKYYLSGKVKASSPNMQYINSPY